MDDVAFQEGLEAHRAGRMDDAAAAYRRALAEQETPAAAHNLGVVLSAQFLFREALEALELADRLRPDHPQTLIALGRVVMLLRRPREAEVILRRALELAPDSADARVRLGWALMMQGRYLEGWPFLESRRARVADPLKGVSFPEWRGEPLDGRSILVWGEQGLGDEIQAARFIPILRERGASAITVVGNALNVRLFEQLGADRVVVREGPMSVAGHDVWTLLWSIPGRLGVTPDTIPNAAYLKSRSGLAADLGRVGVSWRGNPMNANDRQRSMPDDRLMRLVPGAVALEPRGDTLDSLDQIANLSLVITVDSAWAHLAGAMGKPCWLLLSHAGVDWRWFPEAATTPWYPSVRLFWQAHP
ncbi:MAG: tetratricopeptide repeat-containing glycosyltransferase family protein, partial [Phenylobacterium sp.]